MNRKHPSIRVLGQRSIPSSFVVRTLNPSKSSKEDVEIKAPKKDSRISLSEFLDRKLHKNSVLPNTLQGKQRPFSSLASRLDQAGSVHKQIGVRKDGEVEAKCVLDEGVFAQFKHTIKEGEEMDSRNVGEIESANTDGVQESRKRRNPFEDVGNQPQPSRTNDEIGSADTNGVQELRKGRKPFQDLSSCLCGDEKSTARKQLVVLGDDPKPRQIQRGKSFISNKKPRPLYNHYANGSGWWNCDREGVDSEEVGCNEVWEGMGSITLGGLEWH